MATKQYRSGAHDALRPLYLACVEELATNGVTCEMPGSRTTLTRCETLGGAIITRIDDIISVERVFFTITKKDKPAEERIEITFPSDMRDLADSRIDRTLIVNDGEGISGGSVGLKRYSDYASCMLKAVRPVWVNEPA